MISLLQKYRALKKAKIEGVSKPDKDTITFYNASTHFIPPFFFRRQNSSKLSATSHFLQKNWWNHWRDKG